jgi:tryptophan synthase alpha chain
MMITATRRIGERFDQLRSQSRRALVAYITAGHPDMGRSLELCTALEESGVDVLEIGVPFSDPLADGPIIQASSQRALEQGVTLDKTLELIARAKPSIPVVLFTYLNPVLAAGDDALARIRDAGIDGILITDLPVGEDPERESWLSSSDLDFIRLVAPTTPPERIRTITKYASGFVYLISRLGVTGFRDINIASLTAAVGNLRAVTTLPVCVGFGISRPDHARAVGAMADGVVVGSAIVDAASRSVFAAAQLAREMRAALDGR